MSDDCVEGSIKDNAKQCVSLNFMPIEDKLVCLLPLFKNTLATMERVNNILKDGGIDWKGALIHAKESNGVSTA